MGVRMRGYGRALEDELSQKSTLGEAHKAAARRTMVGDQYDKPSLMDRAIYYMLTRKKKKKNG